FHALLAEEFVLVVAPRWADRLPPAGELTPEALSNVPLLAFADDLPIVRRFFRTVLGTRLTIHAALTLPDLRGLAAAVAAGAGYSVLPHYLCRDAIAAGKLTRLFPDVPGPTNTLYLAVRPEMMRDSRVRSVREKLIR
ncbi:MAG: LysR family transcriptional regulator, partial [Candidatus Sericytochromatia bacterium]|nr:LysR family transcriptional regulator [Candidatus Tanganyikabacteria bacterium]